MKKIFTILTLALAMGFAFTGCASKKAKDNGPKIYRVDIGSILGGPIALSEEPTEINISSFFEYDTLPAAGETVRVMWSVYSDSEIDSINVNLGEASEDCVLGKEIPAEKVTYIVTNIPVKEDITGPVYATLWTDKPVTCETIYKDEK
jgi:hypothetical protein